MTCRDKCQDCPVSYSLVHKPGPVHSFLEKTMTELKEKLLDENVRPKVVADCVLLVDEEVAAKKGPSGMVIKMGYKALKTAKPKMVEKAVDYLLPDFVEVFASHHARFMEENKGKDFQGYLLSNRDAVSRDMLAVTDEIVSGSKSGRVKKTYKGMRKTAEKHVSEAMPKVIEIISRYESMETG